MSVQNYDFQTFNSDIVLLFRKVLSFQGVTKSSEASSLHCYAKLPLFLELEDKASSAYLNDFFCYIMSKVGEWWVARCACGLVRLA